MPATARRYLQLDVFADRPGAGNPLGVVLDASGMDTADMQALAAWLNLSESIFFLPPEAGADYRVRIFTPKTELPFAGHPSVGAAWAAVETGLAVPRNGQLVQQCGAGLLPVNIAIDDQGRRIATVRSPRAKTVEAEAPAFPAELTSLLAPGFAPQRWNNGPDFWLLQARDEATLRSPAFTAAAARVDPGDDFMAFAFTRDGNGQLAVRGFFTVKHGLIEDPVTGSANALVAACLHRRGELPANPYLASQGRELGRDGKVQVRVDAEGEVWIGGHVQPVIDGRIDWQTGGHRSAA